MQVSIVPYLVTVLIWFAVAFVTKSWTRQWIVAVIAGLGVAWWRYGAMQTMAEHIGADPISPIRFGILAVGGMLMLASAGMGLRWLLLQSRRT